MSMDLLMKSMGDIDSKINGYKTTQLEFADRLLMVEQKGTARNDGAPGFNDPSNTAGGQFVKQFAANQELFNKTRSVRFEIKGASDAITTASGRKLVSGGAGGPSGGVLGFQNALTSRPATGTSAVEYSRYLGQQGEASVQAGEGAGKSAVRPDFELITQSAITVAGFSKMSRQAMSDSSELRRAVDTTLARSVSQALDKMLTTGGAGFVGGLAGLATPVTSTVYDTLVDAISECVANMQTAGFAPDVVVLNPLDWLAINVAKTATGEYLSGSYVGPMLLELRGLRVVLSASVVQGKAFVLDSTHVEILSIDVFAVEVGYVGDDFTNNLCTLLGELRVIPVFRTIGAMCLITPKPAV